MDEGVEKVGCIEIKSCDKRTFFKMLPCHALLSNDRRAVFAHVCSVLHALLLPLHL